MMQQNNWRFPAEWEAQDAVWISWPHRGDLWQGGLSALQSDFARLGAMISHQAELRVNAAKSLHSDISRLLIAEGADRFALYDHPTDDVWCRDHGPIFVQNRTSGAICMTDWQFNAWGGKFPPWNLDNEVPQRVAESLGLELRSSPLFLEGGSIEGNGAGLLLTTEAVLLNENRNPDWNKQMINAELNRMLGVQSVFWLGAGIEGDDTDGHIDDMVRFTGERRVVSIVEPDSRSPHYASLAENNERLQDLRHLDGSRIEIIPLLMPDPLCVTNWRLEQLPASYANFLIVNDLVIVPVFQQAKKDDRALGILRECFPRKQVMGFDARRLVIEGGAVHCVTQQQPKGKTV